MKTDWLLKLRDRPTDLEAAGRVISAQSAERIKSAVKVVWNSVELAEEGVLSLLQILIDSGNMTRDEAMSVTKGEFDEESGKEEMEASLKTDYQSVSQKIQYQSYISGIRQVFQGKGEVRPSDISLFANELRGLISRMSFHSGRGLDYCFGHYLGEEEKSPKGMSFLETTRRVAWCKSVEYVFDRFCSNFSSLCYIDDAEFSERYGNRDRQGVAVELVDDLESILNELASTKPVTALVMIEAATPAVEEKPEEVEGTEEPIEANIHPEALEPETENSVDIENLLSQLAEGLDDLESSVSDEDLQSQWEGLDGIIPLEFELSGIRELDEETASDSTDIEAAALVQAHPNKKPFEGSLFKIGQASSGIPVIGSRLPLYVTQETAELLEGSMNGLPINADPTLQVHNRSNVIGVFTESYPDGDDFMVKGWLWPINRSDAISLLASTQKRTRLGMSIEAKDVVKEEQTIGGQRVSVLKELTPTGGTVLLANSATYNNTKFDLAAQARDESELLVASVGEQTDLSTNNPDDQGETKMTVENSEILAQIKEMSNTVNQGFTQLNSRQDETDKVVAELQASVRLVEEERKAVQDQQTAENIAAAEKAKLEAQAQMIGQILDQKLGEKISPVVDRLSFVEKGLEASNKGFKTRQAIPAPPLSDALDGGSLEASGSRHPKAAEIREIDIKLEFAKGLENTPENRKTVGRLKDERNALLAAR